jgi:hypothetical protein
MLVSPLETIAPVAHPLSHAFFEAQWKPRASQIRLAEKNAASLSSPHQRASFL